MIGALALRGVHKRFGATIALDDARCTVRAGTVHALLGENGAGKTTLMRVAFGLVPMDAGVCEVEGRSVRFRSSAAAIAAGLGMVHQHFMLIPAMTVAENVALGGHGRFDIRAATERARSVGRDTSLVLDPAAYVRDLPVGAQQRLEIVKALAHDARILILDEPTAVLTPSEAAELMRWLRRFADQGKSVVLITHKLGEALSVADDVTVLRRGRTVLEGSTRTIVPEDVISALVGERSARDIHIMPETALEPSALAAVANVRARHDVTPGAAVFSVRDASYRDTSGVLRLDRVTLDVHEGEVLGVLGVEGAGQRELLRILSGRLTPSTGTVSRPTRVGFIPEDRLRDALIPEMTLTENLALATAGETRGTLDWSALRRTAEGVVDAFEVHTAGVERPIAELSGGNQQKFVVGRERAVAASALVAENPTRGLDIRASARVRNDIGAAVHGQRCAVVYYSSDIEEVLVVATRIVVCFGGHVTEVARGVNPMDVTPFARALMGNA